MPRAALLLVPLVGVAADTEKISTYDQGAKWSGKCIKVTDWNSKDQDGDLDVAARDANGCCPTGYIPGASAYSIGSYVGAQVICGIASDGATTGFKTSSSSCTYGDCYVMKQSTPCTDKTKVLVNGCCGAAATSAATTTFKEKCKKYFTSGKLAGEAGVKQCKSYHKQYKLLGTSVKTDDIAEGKLVLGSKVAGAGKYLYTPCDESGIPGVTSTGASVGSAAPAPTPAPGAASAASFAKFAPLAIFPALFLATLL